MPAGNNVDRLIAAGVLDETTLTAEDRVKINSIDLTNGDINSLSRVKQKLGLAKLEWKNLQTFGLNKL